MRIPYVVGDIDEKADAVVAVAAYHIAEGLFIADRDGIRCLFMGEDTFRRSRRERPFDAELLGERSKKREGDIFPHRDQNPLVVQAERGIAGLADDSRSMRLAVIDIF